MGLVSTWLNGIGLRSVVPTFEAAGIVSPAHLADLDVSYFESLGVTDPDDRRKLFYLVQRIKLAVNNKKDSSSEVRSPTAEERVDAVISEKFDTKDEKNTAKSSKKGFNEEKKVESEPIRRSKRIIAKKKKVKSDSSKENNDVGKELPIPTRKGSPRSTTQKGSNRQRKTKKEVVPSPPQSPRRLSPTNKSSSSLLSSPTGRTSPPKRSPPSKLVKERTEASVRTQNLFSKSSIPSASSSLTSKDDNIDQIDEGVNEQTNNNSRITQTTAQSLHSTDLWIRPESKFPESKLPVSSRASKRSTVPSAQTSASQTAAIESASSIPNYQSEEVRNKRSDAKSRRRVTLAANTDSLLNTFQSSNGGLSRKKFNVNGTVESIGGSFNSSDDTEVTNKRDGSLRRQTTSRSKSMGVSDSALLQQYQRNNQKRSSMLSKPTTTAATISNRTPSITTPSTAVITQVASEASESWATKIGNLREDNDAEHELFRDQVEDESQYHEYYDMRIKVIVRKRPISKSEYRTGGIDIIHPLDYGSYGKTLVYHPKTRVDLTKEVETVPFAFDNVFDESSTNIGIYNRSLRNLVEPFFEGQWATVFAYGQTGSGKTYTMMGSNITGVNAGTSTVDESNFGLYYLAALDIFEMLKLPEYNHLNVHVSLFEIYGGKLFDLLSDRKQIKCLEDSKGKVCFPGLTEHPVHVPEHVMHLIEEGSKNRSTGTTSRNADSSRSHAVLQIKLVKSTGRKKNIEHGRFTFIDLAGSERGADTSNASKATRLEGAEINTSLLALKEVIRALATGGSMTHIPFRGSKLTQVLKDSFVGENARCCMVACISPDIGNCEQTLNTLRYADRVKERNPETGVLSTSCQQPTRMSSSQSFGKTPSSQPIQRSDAPAEENDFSESFHPNDPAENLSYESKFTEKRKAGQALVLNHRSVMSRWLLMVKDEMAMVNQVDADREGLEDYILQLENVQRAQIGFLSELRDSLQTYVSAAEGPHQTGAGQEDDDSFEDLRD